MNITTSDVRKYTHFPRSGAALSSFNVKEANLDLENGTWFVIFDGEVSRSQARDAMKHFVKQPRHIPIKGTSSMVCLQLECDEIGIVRSNPNGAVTMARGHMFYPNARKNPTTASDFKSEMHGMIISEPTKSFKVLEYDRLNSKAFLNQLWLFVSWSGESYGWVTKDKKIYHRRASFIMPKIKINKRPDNELAFYHTHPSKDEPSLTSADDIQFYLDLAFEPGIKHFYTIMKDRIDYFQINVNKNTLEDYLDIDEGRFIKDIDAMIDAGEKKYANSTPDPVNNCFNNTQYVVREFNKRFKRFATISYKQFVNPYYEEVTEKSGPFALPNPGVEGLWTDLVPVEDLALKVGEEIVSFGNPSSHVNPIQPDDKYFHAILNELKGLDYDSVHFGGDEYAHTMYFYWWLKHHFAPSPSHPGGRLWLLEDYGFDSQTRKQVRAYLNTRITNNWTYLDMLYLIGLYHDSGKKVQKETANKIHHSIAAKSYWDEFVADDLGVPKVIEDAISLMYESDVGRRNITPDFFRTQMGDFYGLALIAQFVDSVVHRHHMFTGMAAKARATGNFKGDVVAYKHHHLSEIANNLKRFLDEPRPNPKPIPTQVQWRGSYETPINLIIAAELLSLYGRDRVPDESGDVAENIDNEIGNRLFLRFTTDNLPILYQKISDDDIIKAELNGTGTMAVYFKSASLEYIGRDVGREVAQLIYEFIGDVLKGAFPDVIVDTDDIESVVKTNPRKMKNANVIIISGPSGSGKSTLIRHLKKNLESAGQPLTYTTRPRRPNEKAGVDRVYVKRDDFIKMIEDGELLEWEQLRNGHFYGRRFDDFIYDYNLVDVNLKGARKYMNMFPAAHSIFLRPDVGFKGLVRRLLRRGGMSLEEARSRAKKAKPMVERAKSMDYSHTIEVASGKFDEAFDEILEKIPEVNPKQTTMFGGSAHAAHTARLEAERKRREAAEKRKKKKEEKKDAPPPPDNSVQMAVMNIHTRNRTWIKKKRINELFGHLNPVLFDEDQRIYRFAPEDYQEAVSIRAGERARVSAEWMAKNQGQRTLFNPPNGFTIMVSNMGDVGAINFNSQAIPALYKAVGIKKSTRKGAIGASTPWPEYPDGFANDFHIVKLGGTEVPVDWKLANLVKAMNNKYDITTYGSDQGGMQYAREGNHPEGEVVEVEMPGFITFELGDWDKVIDLFGDIEGFTIGPDNYELFPKSVPNPPKANPPSLFREVSPREFVAARSRAKRKPFLTPLTPEQIQKNQTKAYLSEGGLTGFLIDPNGDLQNIFNIGPEGQGRLAVADAISKGAVSVDAFDPFLPEYYKQFGFEEYGRIPFDDKYAPVDWDFSTYGRPDIVFMVLPGARPNPGGKAYPNPPSHEHTMVCPLHGVIPYEEWDRDRFGSYIHRDCGRHLKALRIKKRELGAGTPQFLLDNPMAPGYQSYSWTTQDWRSIKVNNKGDIDYSEKCGAEGTKTPSGSPRLCLPAEVVRSLKRTDSGKEIIRKQARKKARAKKGERVPWHPRIKKIWKRIEDKTVKDRPNPTGVSLYYNTVLEEFNRKVKSGETKDVLIAKLGGSVVGLIQFGATPGHLIIDTVWVNSSVREQGIMDSMMKKLITDYSNHEMHLRAGGQAAETTVHRWGLIPGAHPNVAQVSSEDLVRIYQKYGFQQRPSAPYMMDRPIMNPKEGPDLYSHFERWAKLVNMKNKELEAFLNSPMGKTAGLSPQEAKEKGIFSGRVSGRRILKMRKKLGLGGPKDYIKGPRHLDEMWEVALKEWTGPSKNYMKGTTDWDWCMRQVRFNERHGAFPYNQNAEERKGPLVRKQKTQNKVSRRLLSLWVWGHDPWRWARKHGFERMPKCPDVPWIGMTEKKKYGKVEVVK